MPWCVRCDKTGVIFPDEKTMENCPDCSGFGWVDIFGMNDVEAVSLLEELIEIGMSSIIGKRPLNVYTHALEMLGYSSGLKRNE